MARPEGSKNHVIADAAVEASTPREATSSSLNSQNEIVEQLLPALVVM